MIFFKRNQRKQHAERLNQLHFAVAHSFNKVKEDSTTMFEWINYLSQQNEQQQQLIRDMHFQLNNMPATKEAVKHVIDNYYSFEPLMEKMRELDDKIAKVSDVAATAAAKEQHDFRPEMREVRNEVLSELREMRSELRDEINRKVESVSDEQAPIIERLRELAKKVDSLEKRPSPAPMQQKPRVSKEERISNLRERIIKKVVRRSKDYVKSMLLKWIVKHERVPAIELREMIVDDQGLCSKSSFYRLLQELEDSGLVDVVSDGKEKIYLAKQLKESIQ